MPGICRPSGTVQHTHYSSTDLTPTALFEKKFDDEVMQLLTDNSNKYALHKGKYGFVTSPMELHVRLFKAILFNSGYAPLPRRRLYWEPSPDVQNTAVNNAITRNRFEELMANVHVADNDNLAPNDHMAKVRPLFTALNSKFVTHFPRQQDLSVDESMVPYHGRHSTKQYIRGKPIRFGYKVWSINTSLGYCMQLDPYHCTGTTIPELGLGGSIVVKICSVLPSENYVVYLDNFFTSLLFLQRLSASGIKVQCVSIALKTALSAVEKVKKMTRGTSDHRLDSNSNIVIVRWHDNRWTLKTVACVVDATDISPELQMVQWSMPCPISLAVYDPYSLHGYVQQVSRGDHHSRDRMDIM